jgi:hypothetical protein
MTTSNTRGPQTRARSVTDTVNLRAYDRLPKAVRRWLSQDALLQYSAVSVAKAYRGWRREFPDHSIQAFINKGAGHDIANAALDSTDPRFIELMEEARA